MSCDMRTTIHVNSQVFKRNQQRLMVDRADKYDVREQNAVLLN